MFNILFTQTLPHFHKIKNIQLYLFTETIAQKCSVKKVLLEILQNLCYEECTYDECTVIKLKKGKHCITYMLQLNLTKLKLDHSLSVTRIFQSLVVKALPCSVCFTTCMSVHFLVVKLGCGSDDSLWHGST